MTIRSTIIWTTTCLALGLGLPLGAAASTPPESFEWIQRAEKLIAKNKLDKAVELLWKADEAAGGNSAEALIPLTRAYLQGAQFPEATATAETLVAAATDPEVKATGYRLLGRVLFEGTLADSHQEQRYNFDLMMFAAKLPPSTTLEDAVDQIKHYRLSKYSKKLELAQSALEKAIELQGSSYPLNHYYLAEVLTSLGDTDEAAAHLEKLFELTETSDLPRGPRELQCYLQKPLKPEETIVKLARKEFTQARALERKKPKYNKKALVNHVSGTVFLAAVVDQEGDVTCIRSLRGLPMGLTEAAITAVEESKFEPAHLGGKPVSVAYHLQVSFHGW